MDLTEFTFLNELGVDIEKIKLSKLTEVERSSIEFYVEITRHIQEIEQLFRVFNVNLENIFHYYEFNSNDIIIRKKINELNQNDYIIINTFVTNYISSGKSLKETIEVFMKQNIGEDSQKTKTFINDYSRKLYDDVFSYRFLLRIRDFSQHGHLPVNKDSLGKYFFNLNSILATPHFQHNKALEEEMKNIRDEICNKYSAQPRITFTLSIAEFNLCIIKTYKGFIDIIKDTLYDSVQKVSSILDSRPDLIYKSKDCLNEFVIYSDINNELHCFDSKDDAIKMFLEIEKNLSEVLKYHEKELKEIKKNFDFNY